MSDRISAKINDILSNHSSLKDASSDIYHAIDMQDILTILLLHPSSTLRLTVQFAIRTHMDSCDTNDTEPPQLQEMTTFTIPSGGKCNIPVLMTRETFDKFYS